MFKHDKPIFVELCNETLLKRCIDCKTLNQNQAFNGTVWRLLPKITCGLSVVSTYTILLLFIIDRKATIDVYAEMKINSGMYVYNYQNQENIIMKRKL